MSNNTASSSEALQLAFRGIRTHEQPLKITKGSVRSPKINFLRVFLFWSGECFGWPMTGKTPLSGLRTLAQNPFKAGEGGGQGWVLSGPPGRHDLWLQAGPHVGVLPLKSLDFPATGSEIPFATEKIWSRMSKGLNRE